MGIFIPRGRIDSEPDNFNTTTTGSQLPIQATTPSLTEDDVTVVDYVINGSGMAETVTTHWSRVTTNIKNNADATSSEEKTFQYVLIVVGATIFLIVTVAIYYKTRKWRHIPNDERNGDMTSSEFGGGAENVYEIGENPVRRNSMVNQAFHSTEINGHGLSERAMTYNVLYALEQQDPDYAVITETTQPKRLSDTHSNPESVIYDVIDKSKNGHAPNINQSDDATSKLSSDIQSESQLPYFHFDPADINPALQISESESQLDDSDSNRPIRDSYASVSIINGVKSTVHLT